MKALTYHGSKDVRVETMPDPVLAEADAHGFLFGDAFEKGLTFKSGQTHAQRFMPELLERISAGDIRPEAIVTHTLSLDDAVRGYEVFNEKQEDCRKVILRPGAASVFPPEGVRA